MNSIKSFALIIIILFSTSSVFSIDLEYVRKNYEKAPKNETLCEQLIKDLSSSQHGVNLAYLGAFQTMWANHTINPYTKLETFNKGKKNIEKAVKSSPQNLEIRFIRLSIQKNSPSFLGYNKNIEEDKTFIKNNLNTIQSTTLKNLCVKIIN